MTNKNISIKVENLSKMYRIGASKDMQGSLAATVFGYIKSPFRNYRKYRSLYKFDDIKLVQEQKPQGLNHDIILAVNDVSFSVERGDVLGIIGANGAGKSTLLKILCKITTPTLGSAKIRGRVSSLLEVGTGFHQELTGRENIYLNGTILGMTKKEIDQKFDEIVYFSGVEKFIDTPVKRYSSGMTVRLAFSVAAHLEPEVMIVDEVLAVGDAEFQKKCLDKMESIGQQGRTVLFVSHNMPAMTRLCKRAILMHQGQIIEDGPSGEVVNSYLFSGSDTNSSREWSDPDNAPGGPSVRLWAVRVRTQDGQASSTMDIRRPIHLEMEYEVMEEGHVLNPHFVLYNEAGEIVFITSDQDPKWRRRKRQKGRYLSTAVIPGNLLAEGIIMVSCNCHTLNPDVLQFMAQNAVSFHVVDSMEGDSARGDWAKDMPGVVRPLLDWKTEFYPN
jgi:lipopolysaccharide transport system ATP-binding protein